MVSSEYKTFDGKDVCPSIEGKVDHLLYFIVKNHTFSDGNIKGLRRQYLSIFWQPIRFCTVPMGASSSL